MFHLYKIDVSKSALTCKDIGLGQQRDFGSVNLTGNLIYWGNSYEKIICHAVGGDVSD